MRSSFILILGLSFNLFFSQVSETEAVKAGVNKLFTAMKNSDSAGIKSSFTKQAILQTIMKNGEVKTEAIPAFAGTVAKAVKNTLEERITFSAIHIDGNLASVWTPYQFYFQGKFSHCGVNSFQMIKENGDWKIQYIIDTRRKDGCIQDDKTESVK
ncbi:nuclear transport factor 2 family protein [Elizabethkingia ursingii]|uniref:nuclear transport factor 2 family protein n=1 Tax=Elizabethkingia ursingii TaxID=1756150 RepID=UPI0020110498|nr:nuclear transport factor 2 family protein [Elizabethkingia ursingii]MCL1671610.1 nuclear transport factor 2 family protein [Elizabethkingia ursingii]